VTVANSAPTPQPTPAPTADTSGPSPDSTAPISTDGLSGPSLEPAPTATVTRTSAPLDGKTVGRRVLDRGATDGLLETIVGGVTGIFFGG
jgi:hypothetical protein